MYLGKKMEDKLYKALYFLLCPFKISFDSRDFCFAKLFYIKHLRIHTIFMLQKKLL